MKKPIFVWIVSILAVIGFLYSIYNIFVVKIFSDVISTTKIFYVASFLLGIFGLIFIYYFFTLSRKKALLWNNITFALAIIYDIVAGFYDQTTDILKNRIISTTYQGSGIIAGIIGLIIIFIFWNIFRIYIKKSQSFNDSS